VLQHGRVAQLSLVLAQVAVGASQVPAFSPPFVPAQTLPLQQSPLTVQMPPWGTHCGLQVSGVPLALVSTQLPEQHIASVVQVVFSFGRQRAHLLFEQSPEQHWVLPLHADPPTPQEPLVSAQR
jgi:hypothetical protein